MDLSSYIRTVPNFPKEGIMFKDITTLIKDPVGFESALDDLFNMAKNMKITKVVGIESRGFIMGAALAFRLGVGFIPIRGNYRQKLSKSPTNLNMEPIKLKSIKMH